MLRCFHAISSIILLRVPSTAVYVVESEVLKSAAPLMYIFVPLVEQHESSSLALSIR